MTKQEKRIKNAIAILVRSNYIRQYSCWETLLCTEDEDKIKKEYNSLELLLTEIVASYRCQKKFISPSVILDELYSFFHNSQGLNISFSDVTLHIGHFLNQLGMIRPTISIVPLHSYRIERPLFPKQRAKHDETIIKYENFWIVPQTHDFDRTLNVIQQAFAEWVGPEKIDWSEYLHYKETPVYSWLESNPILLVKSFFSQESPLENAYPWIIQYRYVCAKIYARSLYDLPDEILCSGSDSWEIYHVLYVMKKQDSIYHIDMSPHFEKSQLVNDFSHVNVKFSPSYKDCLELQKVFDCIDVLYDKKVVDDTVLLRGDKRTPKIEKIHNALYFFCKSFKTEFLIDQIVFLQTAFETLLIDIRTANKRNYLLDRVSFLLKRKKLAIACNPLDIVGKLIDLRNGIIHSGLLPKKGDIDLRMCRYVFLQIFKEMVDKIDLFSNGEDFFTQYIYEHTTKIGKVILQLKRLCKKAKTKISDVITVVKKNKVRIN